MTEITKADMTYRDGQGEEWINAEAIAELWNKRAQDEYHSKGRYSRWSARNRAKTSGDLQVLETVKGNLYNKREAETIPLAPHPKARPDLVEDNQKRGFRKKPISEQK